MNRLISVVTICVLMMGMGACCSKKGQCSLETFKKIEIVNFPDSVLGDITFRTYDSTTLNPPVNSQVVTAVATSDPKVYSFETPDENDRHHIYSVYFAKSAKEFVIDGFTLKKVVCGKCFLKANNQIGYELSGYDVNGRGMSYNGVIRVYNK